MDIMEFENVLNYSKNNIEFLSTSLGIFFIICAFVGIIIAVFTYPKHILRNFFIYAVCIFFATSFFWYIDTNSGSFQFVRLIYYIKDYLSYWSFGIGYTFVLGILFWGAVGITAITGRNKEISLVKRTILIVGIGSVAIIFAKLCNDIVFIFAITIGQKWYDIMMT